MPDLQEVFRVSTQKVHPEQGALDRQHRRQRRSARNRKAGAFALVAAILVVLVALGLTLRTGSEEQPAQSPSSPSSVPLRTTAPIGPPMIGTDGTTIQQLPPLPGDASAVRASPDGSALAYVYGGEVATVRMDGTDQKVLTSGLNDNNGDAQNTVSWSPDGSRVTYSSSGNIFVINADGTEQHQLTTTASGVGNYYPAWSPDGQTIAYWRGSTSGVDGGPPHADIYTVPAAGGAPTRLTHGGGPDIEPAWSPDGSHIVFRSGWDLRVMRADGTGQHVVLKFRNGPWAPVWSPDGTRIALLRYDPSERALDGGPLLRLLVLTLSNGRTADLGVRVKTDLNGAQWVSNDGLLVNRYD
jgi:Tol biopolymer transport system component